MSETQPKLPKSKKKNFSSFNYAEAFRQLDLLELISWKIAVEPLEPSAFFQERLQRLEQSFDLQSYEESKKLLIDAICEEAILATDRLRIWKGAQLESDVLADMSIIWSQNENAFSTLPCFALLRQKRMILKRD